MKTFLFIVCSFCLVTGTYAQIIRIKDKTSRIAIPEVTGMGNKSLSPVHSGVKGEFYADQFSGNDSVTFSHVGFYPLTVSLAQAVTGNVYLSERSFELDEVVVSSGRFEEKKNEVPQQIQVIHARDLEFMNQPTSADVLSQSGNILVQKSQFGGGSPIIRGFEANKVLLVVDGVRMNNAIYRAGHLQNCITVDNTMLEKTEIIFGPASVVYGSDALGGVVHFFTRQPVLADSGQKKNIRIQAFSRYSSAANEKTGHIQINAGFKKIAFLSAFTFSDFGDLKTGSQRNPAFGDWGKRNIYTERINNKDSVIKNNDPDVQKKSGYGQLDAMQKIVFQQNNYVRHTVNLQYSGSSRIHRYDRLSEVDGKGRLKSAEWYYGPQLRMFGSYSLNLHLNKKLVHKARIILAVQNIEESRHNRNMNSVQLNHRYENVKVYSFNADFSKQLGRHELRYGTELTYNNIQSSAQSENIETNAVQPLDTRYPDGGSEMKTGAAYITHSWELHPKWVLSDGLRYTRTSLSSVFNDKTFFPFPYEKLSLRNSALSGNLGLVFHPGHNLKLSALASTGFRSPNLDDVGKVFEQSGGGRVMVPNPNLKPEYTCNAEAGITKGFLGTTWLQLNGFYTWYRQAITVQNGSYLGQDSILYDKTPSKVLMLGNVTNAYICGISASLLSDISEHFAVNASVNYTYGRTKTDSSDYPLDHIAPVFGKAGVILKLKKFKTEFYSVYNGWKRPGNYNKLGEDNFSYATSYGTPAWATFNIRTSYNLNRYVQLQAAIENILDTHYRGFASGISAPGRNFVLTVRGSF